MNNEPLVQCVGDRPSALLTQPLAPDCVQLLLACLTFDLVELTEELQGLCGEIATMVGIKLVELAPSVRFIHDSA